MVLRSMFNARATRVAGERFRAVSSCSRLCDVRACVVWVHVTLGAMQLRARVVHIPVRMLLCRSVMRLPSTDRRLIFHPT